MYRSWVVAFAAVMLVAGQVPPSVGQERVRRIINGVPTADFESVGIVGSAELGQFCSGVLITGRHVLTAAHCAEVAISPFDGTFEIDGETYTTSAIHIHPDYDPDAVTNDLAIYELSEPVPEVVPSPIFLGTPRIGDELTIVGFGGGGDASGDDGTFGDKRSGTTTIDGVAETEIIWFFDDEQEANTGFGDSGGPGFLQVDGEFFVASITSSGTDPNAALGDVAFNTRVDAFADWIVDIVESVGDDVPPPVDDDPPPPLGDDPPPLVDDDPPPVVDDPAPPQDDGLGIHCPGRRPGGGHGPGHRPWGHRPGGHGRRPFAGPIAFILWLLFGS